MAYSCHLIHSSRRCFLPVTNEKSARVRDEGSRPASWLLHLEIMWNACVLAIREPCEYPQGSEKSEQASGDSPHLPGAIVKLGLTEKRGASGEQLGNWKCKLKNYSVLHCSHTEIILLQSQ